MKSLIICLTIISFVFISSSCTSNIQENNSLETEDSTISESITNQQMEQKMPQNLISAEIKPLPSQGKKAALKLQNLGFKVLHIGKTISVQAPRSLWESTFNVSFKEEKKTVMAETKSEETYLKAITDKLTIPEGLENVISEVMFVEPPEFFHLQP